MKSKVFESTYLCSKCSAIYYQVRFLFIKVRFFSIIFAFKIGINVILMNLTNILDQTMWYFQRLHHSSMHLLFLQVWGKKNEWLVCQVTNILIEQSDVVPLFHSSSVNHHPTIVSSVSVPSTVARPPILQIYSRRRKTDDTCHAQILLSDPPKTLAYLLLFPKVHVLANPHISLLVLFSMTTYPCIYIFD